MIIYLTLNILNGKYYVGYDSYDRSIDLYAGSGIILKNAICKYGIENFRKITLEYVNIDNWKEREIYWIKLLNAQIYGYNIMKGGNGGDNFTYHPDKELIIKKRTETILALNRKVKEDQRMKMSASQKRRCQNRTPEEIQRTNFLRLMAIKNRHEREGLSMLELEGRKKCINALVKNNKSEEFRKKQSERMKRQQTGKVFSEEHRKNMGISRKGKPNKHRKEISIDNVQYNCVSHASKELGIPMNTIRFRLKSDNFKDYLFV